MNKSAHVQTGRFVLFGVNQSARGQPEPEPNSTTAAPDLLSSISTPTPTGSRSKQRQPAAMGADCKYELSQAAYIKLVLHSLKHRSAAVNGLLLGRLLDDSSATVQIADAVPLSHSNIGLMPSLELALHMVEEHFGAEGLSVVGYYHANERADDSELRGAAKNIGDHIFRCFPRAAVLLLDAEKMQELPKRKGRDPAVQLYSRDSSKGWRQSGSDGTSQLTLKEPSANAVLLDYIASEKWQEIVDFDDHLDDISKDWLNPDLFK